MRSSRYGVGAATGAIVALLCVAPVSADTGRPNVGETRSAVGGAPSASRGMPIVSSTAVLRGGRAVASIRLPSIGPDAESRVSVRIRMELRDPAGGLGTGKGVHSIRPGRRELVRIPLWFEARRRIATVGMARLRYSVRATGRRATRFKAVSGRITVIASTTRYVDPNGTDSGDCTVAPCRTPGYALTQTEQGDTVSVAPGTYSATVAIPNLPQDVTLVGSTPADPPNMTAGINFRNTAAVDSLTLMDLYVTGIGHNDPNVAAVVSMIDTGAGRTPAPVNDLTLYSVTVDGRGAVPNPQYKVCLRFSNSTCAEWGDPYGLAGLAGAALTGALTIERSTFENLTNPCTVDVACAGGGTVSTAVDSFSLKNSTFSNNHGWVGVRGQVAGLSGAYSFTPVQDVDIEGNSWTEIGPANNSFGAAMKIFYAENVTVAGNVWTDVGPTGFSPTGETPYGAALDLRRVANGPNQTATITENTFSGSLQGIAIEPATSDTNPPLAPAGTISGNDFASNAAGIYFPRATQMPQGLTVAANAFRLNGVGATAGAESSTMNLENNWWNCNGGPGTPGCDATTGDAVTQPALALRLNTSVNRVEAGGPAAVVSADLTRNSAGAIAGTGLPPLSVLFSSSLGTIAPTTAVATGGAASAAFVGAGDGVTALLSAQVGNAVATTGVDVFGPPQPAPTVPAPPTDVRIVSISRGGIEIAWNPSVGATSYSVYRAEVAVSSETAATADVKPGPYKLLTQGLPTTDFTDTTAVLGTTYAYAVTAGNAAGSSDMPTREPVYATAARVTCPGIKATVRPARRATRGTRGLGVALNVRTGMNADADLSGRMSARVRGHPRKVRLESRKRVFVGSDAETEVFLPLKRHIRGVSPGLRATANVILTLTPATTGCPGQAKRPFVVHGRILKGRASR